MKTYEQAKLDLQKNAVMCGGVSHIDGKELRDKGGYYYLDGKKVANPLKEVFAKVEIDESAIKEEMNR